MANTVQYSAVRCGSSDNEVNLGAERRLRAHNLIETMKIGQR